MNRLPHLRHALIALAILLGQWLSLAHALEHPALAPDKDCQICVHAQGLQGGLAPGAVKACVLPPQAVTPAAMQALPAPVRPRRSPAVPRAPPANV